MKKTTALLLALVLCLSLCACGNKYQKQAEEVAPKLSGMWGSISHTTIGDIYKLYAFEFEDGTGGNVTRLGLLDDTPISTTVGTFSVSTKKNGIINLSFDTFADNSGKKDLDEPKEEILHYTYEDGSLNLTDDSGNTIFFVQ